MKAKLLEHTLGFYGKNGLFVIAQRKRSKNPFVELMITVPVELLTKEMIKPQLNPNERLL